MLKKIFELVFGEDTGLSALQHPSQDWSDHSNDDRCPICGKKGATLVSARTVSFGGETSYYDDYECDECGKYEVNY